MVFLKNNNIIYFSFKKRIFNKEFLKPQGLLTPGEFNFFSGLSLRSTFPGNQQNYFSNF